MLRRLRPFKTLLCEAGSKRFEPTELGRSLINWLLSFSQILSMWPSRGDGGKLDDVELGKEEWQKSLMPSTNHSLKEVAKAEEEMEKIKSKTNQLVLIVKSVGSPMVIKLGRFGKFYACISQIVVILKPLSKKSGWNVQTVIRDKSSSVNQTKSYFLWL